MNQKRIGKFIKEKRIEKDLTQVVLAEKLGVSNRSISKWENGVCLPDYSVLNDLCKILDISVDELLNGEEMEKIKKDKKKSKRKVLFALIIFLIVFYILYNWGEITRVYYEKYNFGRYKYRWCGRKF